MKSPVEKIDNLSNEQQRLLKAMRHSVGESAEKLKLDPALLASRKELEKLIRAEANGQQIPERFLGWRKDVITNDLMQLMH